MIHSFARASQVAAVFAAVHTSQAAVATMRRQAPAMPCRTKGQRPHQRPEAAA
jgi:hypothetical protein